MIPYGRQDISNEDIASITEVMQSDWLTQGPTTHHFEQAVAKKVNAEFAVAVNSATSALHIACLALKLGPGDWLWTSPNTFVASANCALYCGAKIDFVDINPRTYNMSVIELKEKLIEAERFGRLPKVVIPVHFSGQSCEMEEIHNLSKQYGFKIIEDASHAIGGLYKEHPIGNCQHSDITIFSFHPVKVMTTAEGGIAVTNDEAIASRMQRLRSHGIIRSPEFLRQNKDEPWYYEQIELGFNYRMTDIQAALGVSQLNRLDQFIKRRHEIVKLYNDQLTNLPLVLPYQHQDAFSSYHLYVIQVNKEKTSIDRKTLFVRLREAGIGVNVHYIPVHTQPYYQQLNFKKGQFPEAERYYSNAISLPIFSTLRIQEQLYVIEMLAKELRE